MKIYGTGVYDNEQADLVGLGYCVLAIERTNIASDWLDSRQEYELCQFLLAELDMLLTLAKKFPKDMNVKLKKSQVVQWRLVFETWYEKSAKRIHKTYREAIRQNADEIFKQFEPYGHSLDWL